MTLMEHQFVTPVAPMGPHRVQVRWTAMQHDPDGDRSGAFAHSCAILAIETLDDQRAVMEFWVENRSRRQVICERRLVNARSCLANGFLQIDVTDLVRITIRLESSMDCERDARPLYARCNLLAKAGFAAGTFNPPTATVAPTSAQVAIAS
jgi:hypothetical protein